MSISRRLRHGIVFAILLLTWAGGSRCAGADLPRSTGGRVPLIRVGVAPEVAAVRLSAEGAWQLGVTGSCYRPTPMAKGEEWTVRALGGTLLLRDAAGRARGSVKDTLFVFPEDSESGSLLLDGRAYRGQLLVWGVGDRVTAVNVVDLESYVRAVLPQEMGPQPFARTDALRAQAVAARSYTLSTLGRWADRGFDLLATIEDQVYGGLPAERPVCSQAVEDTRGVVAVYQDHPIRAYYSSTCGGHTGAPEEVWTRPGAPYLCGVRDMTSRVDHSFCASSPWFKWTEEWKGKEFETMLASSIPRVRGDWSAARYGRLVGVSIRERSASARVSCLSLEFQRGRVDLRGDEIRWVLRRPRTKDGLRSALLIRVDVARKGGRISKVRISGQGYGHGVGLCQFGAMGMSEAGYSYDQIVHFYYRGADLRRYY
jgi:stage II sporulation protein D